MKCKLSYTSIKWASRLFIEAVRNKGPTKISPAEVLFLGPASNVQNLTESGHRFSDKLDPITFALQRLERTTISFYLPGLGDIGYHKDSLSGFQSLSRPYLRVLASNILRQSKASRLSVANEVFWAELIEQVKPKVIFGIGLHRELCRVATDAGVKTFEVQHGIFEPDDLKSRRQHYTENENGSLPTALLTWDDFYTQMAESEGVHAETLGLPFASLESGEFLNLGVESGIEQDRNSRQRISVMSGWGYKDCPSPERILGLKIIPFMRSCEPYAPEFELVIRLHPYVSHKRSLKRVLRWLKINFPAWSVQLPSDTPLQEVIQSSKVVLSNGSSSMFEVHAYGGINVAPQGSFEKSTPTKIHSETITSIKAMTSELSAPRPKSPNSVSHVSLPTRGVRLLKEIMLCR